MQIDDIFQNVILFIFLQNNFQSIYSKERIKFTHQISINIQIKFQKMESNIYINTIQQHFNKFSIDEKTQSQQNFSKSCENCRLIKDELEAQIFLLKDKSHQSFMQVIQVQQLHEEEMQLMKVQHQQEIQTMREQIQRLQREVSRSREQLSLMQKNYKHHTYNMLQREQLLIENIAIIQCNQDSERKSILNDSSICQFEEIVHGRYFKTATHFQQQMKVNDQEGQRASIQNDINNTESSQQKISKLNLRILQLQCETQNLWETNQQLKKQCIKLQTNEKSIKNNYDALFKESKFMADHIRTLANDKFKLERKVKELEKELREQKIKNVKKSFTLDEKSSMFMSLRYNDLSNTLTPHQQTENQILNIKNSFEKSIEEKQNEHEHLMFAKVMSTEHLTKSRQDNPQTRSQLLLVNNDMQPRKSMPSYKKVSHISPSPTLFKKITPRKSTHKQLTNIQIQSSKKTKQYQLDNSDFMEQIKRQVQIKASKTQNDQGASNDYHKNVGFIQMLRKKSSTPH